MENTKSGITRLSCDFNRGYTKAIQDIIKIFKYVNIDLKYHHKLMTYKWAMKLLECCLENRMKLRDDLNGFIRVNGDDFEFFNGTN